MNNYENEQYQEIEKWKSEEPGVVTRALGVVMQPAAWLVTKIIPKKAIDGALELADRAADFMTDTDDVIRDGGVSSVEELRTKDLEILDKLANEVQNWAILAAAAEGGVAGLFGILSLPVDIPALIIMCLRVIHKIGVCYGYECKTERDQQFIKCVLAAAGANDMKEKTMAVVFLQRVNFMIAHASWKKLATDKGIVAIAITLIRNLAKQLGINITKRKAAQAIPIIGSVVGGTLNAAMLSDVAWAARRMFQQRWLIENGKIDISKEDITGN